MLTVQVANDLFGYQHLDCMQSQTSFVQITGLANPFKAKLTVKAASKVQREFPSAPVSYKDEAIVITGGYNPANEDGEYF